METKLTAKQEKFVQGLIAGKTKAAAYREAYGCKNWSDSAVYAAASRTFKNTKVLLRYEDLKKQSEKESGYSAADIRAMVIDEYVSTLKADITDFYDIDQFGYAHLKDLSKVNTKPIKSIKTDKEGKITGIEFYDKARAIDGLKELYDIGGDQTDRNEITISGGTEYAD